MARHGKSHENVPQQIGTCVRQLKTDFQILNLSTRQCSRSWKKEKKKDGYNFLHTLIYKAVLLGIQGIRVRRKETKKTALGGKFPQATFRAQESCIEGKANNLTRAEERFTVNITTRTC